MTNTRNSFLNSSIALLISCWFVVFLRAEEAVKRARATVVLTARLERANVTNVVLRLRLSNTGTNSISMPLGYLPWDRYAMTIALIGTDPYSTPIKQRVIVSDPPPGEPLKIGRDKSLEGQINLNNRFPDLVERLSREDVILFWSYECRSDGVSVERVGGWLVIPKIE